MLALVLATSLSFIFFMAVFMPGGILLARKFAPSVVAVERFALALVFSSLVALTLLSSFRLLGLPMSAQAWLFRGIAFFALVQFLRSAQLRDYCEVNFLLGVSFWMFAFYVATFSSAYPGAMIADVNPHTIQRLAGLATDNLISYNVARMFTENIPFSAYEVVPGWLFSDRGPAAGMLSAVMMLVLGAQDNGLWLSARAGVFFSFEAFLIWLNTYALYVVWVLTLKYGTRQAALASMLLLGSSFFFWINTFFTWPKLFAAAVFLLGLSYMFEKRALSGLLLALSLLAHESVSFTLLSLGVYVLGLGFLQREQTFSFRFLARSAAGFGIVYLPWMLYKVFATTTSHRLLYNHLFCFHGAEVEQWSFSTALMSYVRMHSLGDLISIRLMNVAYPFNFFHAFGAYENLWDSPFALGFSISHLVFYQFLYALGIPSLALVLINLRSRQSLRPLLWVALGGEICAGVMIACPLMTVNHVWAYPLFLLCTAAAAVSAARGGWGSSFLFSAAICSNIFFSIVCFYFVQSPFASVHASWGFIFLQAGTLMLFLLAICAALIRARDE